MHEFNGISLVRTNSVREGNIIYPYITIPQNRHNPVEWLPCPKKYIPGKFQTKIAISGEVMTNFLYFGAF